MAININAEFLKWFAKDKNLNKLELKRYLSMLISEFTKQGNKNE